MRDAAQKRLEAIHDESIEPSRNTWEHSLRSKRPKSRLASLGMCRNRYTTVTGGDIDVQQAKPRVKQPRKQSLKAESIEQAYLSNERAYQGTDCSTHDTKSDTASTRQMIGTKVSRTVRIETQTICCNFACLWQYCTRFEVEHILQTLAHCQIEEKSHR